MTHSPVAQLRLPVRVLDRSRWSQAVTGKASWILVLGTASYDNSRGAALRPTVGQP